MEKHLTGCLTRHFFKVSSLFLITPKPGFHALNKFLPSAS